MAVVDFKDALERAYRLGWNKSEAINKDFISNHEWTNLRDNLAKLSVDNILKEMRINFT